MIQRYSIVIFVVLLASVQHGHAAERAGGDIPDSEITAELPADYRSPGASPPSGAAIRRYAIDDPGDAATNFGVAPVHDNMVFAAFQGDRLEYRALDGNDVLLWDIQAWIGPDFHKLYVESEGEKVEGGDVEAAQIELFYGHAVFPFWDMRAGVRYDPEPNPERGFAAIGVQGLAPQWFEVELNAYLSEDGDLSAAFEAEYDILLSQRLVLQPRIETEVAAQDVPEYAIGAGLTGWEVGLRLRYEITRKFAPYVGISWEQALGETADLVRAEGESVEDFAFVAGARIWF
jgi:copper resistance protein B